MNVGGISSIPGLGSVGGPALRDAGAIASATVREIGQRIQAWAGTPSGHPSGGGFAPDRGELARGGDVYGLKQIAADIGARFDASPVDQGALERALTSFTQAAVVQVVGLAGASGEQQMAGIAAAGITGDGASGIGGVIDGIEGATAWLAAANG